MKLQFKNQAFQEAATAAVCDVFEGQPTLASLTPFAEEVKTLVDSVRDPNAAKKFIQPSRPKPLKTNKNFDRAEFKELWKRINHKAAYTVEFSSEELIKKAIDALDKEIDIPKLTYTVKKATQTGSFVYRYDDCTVVYSRVHPFDLDFDGLENSVDPEPLVAGPDAHGTNVEWYNVVCSNVYEAAEGGPGAVPAMADTEVGPCFTVGIDNEPTPSFTIDCQKVFFLNDADVLDGGATNRPERIRPVTFNLKAPQGTSGTILVSADGTANPVVCNVVDGVTNRVTPMTPLPISVTDSFACTGQRTVYVSCPCLGTGTLSATFYPDGAATSMSAGASFKCIEPLRKLVTTEKAPDGRFYNPSRLVMGTNAVLQVGVNGDFDATNVHWRVVSGPATVSPAGGFTTTVTPTGTNEDVVVEARFNGDEIQPRFVLPIVMPRTIPVRFFVMRPPVDKNSDKWLNAELYAMLDKANEIYTQVGIRFDLVGDPAYVGTTNDWNMVLGTNYVNRFGMKMWRYSSECRTLLDSHAAADCIEVYFLGSILYPRDYAAAKTPYGIVVSRKAGVTALAHEFGHALGLEDCHVRFSRRDGMVASIARADEPVDGDFFLFGIGDWGMERGRGFYEKPDAKLVVMPRLLMHGVTAGGDADIPAGKVISLPRAAKTETQFGTCNAKVGADHFKPENQEVYSR